MAHGSRAGFRSGNPTSLHVLESGTDGFRNRSCTEQLFEQTVCGSVSGCGTGARGTFISRWQLHEANAAKEAASRRATAGTAQVHRTCAALQEVEEQNPVKRIPYPFDDFQTKGAGPILVLLNTCDRVSRRFGLTFERTLAYPPAPAGEYVLVASPPPARRAATCTVTLRPSALTQLLVGTRCRGPGQLDWSCAFARTPSTAAASTTQDVSYRVRGRMTCKNALVVFEEIPPRPAPQSQRFYIFYFAVILAAFPVFSTTMWWVRWPHPLSLGDQIFLGGTALISLPSGMFLVAAKSATPSDNQERLRGLVQASFLVQLVLRILFHG